MSSARKSVGRTFIAWSNFGEAVNIVSRVNSVDGISSQTKVVKQNTNPIIGRVAGVCGGTPIIIGTRIRVADIAQLRFHLHYTIGAIIRAYPGLHKRQIKAALQYYKENETQIGQEIKEDEEA